MIQRFWSKVTNVNQLKDLAVSAALVGKRCVGVSDTGLLYTYADNKHSRVTIEEAASILETTVEQIEKIVAAKGDYIIVDEIKIETVESVVAEEVEDDDDYEEDEVDVEGLEIEDVYLQVDELKQVVEELPDKIANKILKKLQPIIDYFNSIKLD